MSDQNHTTDTSELYTLPPAQDVKKIIIEIAEDGTLNYSIDSRLCLWESLGVLDVISQSLKNNHIDSPVRAAIAELKHIINYQISESAVSAPEGQNNALINSIQSILDGFKKT